MQTAAFCLLALAIGLWIGMELQQRSDDLLMTYANVNHCAKGDQQVTAR